MSVNVHKLLMGVASVVVLLVLPEQLSADAPVPIQDGHTPGATIYEMNIAVRTGNLEAFTRLVSSFPLLQSMPLQLAISSAVPGLRSKNTLLHVAVGALPQVASSDGDSHNALGGMVVTAQTSSILQRLIALGADPLVPNAQGQTPVYLAAAHGSLAALELLFATGTSPSRSDGDEGFSSEKNWCAASHAGWTPVHAAAHRGHSQVVLFLLQEMGCSLEALTHKQFSPLHLAVQGGWIETVTLIVTSLESKAAKHIALRQQTACLHRPEDIASLRKDDDMLAILKHWGSADDGPSE